MVLRPELRGATFQCEVCPSPWRSGRPTSARQNPRTNNKEMEEMHKDKHWFLSQAGGVSLALGPAPPWNASLEGIPKEKGEVSIPGWHCAL